MNNSPLESKQKIQGNFFDHFTLEKIKNGLFKDVFVEIKIQCINIIDKEILSINNKPGIKLKKIISAIEFKDINSTRKTINESIKILKDNNIANNSLHSNIMKFEFILIIFEIKKEINNKNLYSAWFNCNSLPKGNRDVFGTSGKDIKQIRIDLQKEIQDVGRKVLHEDKLSKEQSIRNEIDNYYFINFGRTEDSIFALLNVPINTSEKEVKEAEVKYVQELKKKTKLEKKELKEKLENNELTKEELNAKSESIDKKKSKQHEILNKKKHDYNEELRRKRENRKKGIVEQDTILHKPFFLQNSVEHKIDCDFKNEINKIEKYFYNKSIFGLLNVPINTSEVELKKAEVKYVQELTKKTKLEKKELKEKLENNELTKEELNAKSESIDVKKAKQLEIFFKKKDDYNKELKRKNRKKGIDEDHSIYKNTIIYPYIWQNIEKGKNNHGKISIFNKIPLSKISEKRSMDVEGYKQEKFTSKFVNNINSISTEYSYNSVEEFRILLLLKYSDFLMEKLYSNSLTVWNKKIDNLIETDKELNSKVYKIIEIDEIFKIKPLKIIDRDLNVSKSSPLDENEFNIRLISTNLMIDNLNFEKVENDTRGPKRKEDQVEKVHFDDKFNKLLGDMIAGKKNTKSTPNDVLNDFIDFMKSIEKKEYGKK